MAKPFDSSGSQEAVTKEVKSILDSLSRSVGECIDAVATTGIPMEVIAAAIWLAVSKKLFHHYGGDRARVRDILAGATNIVVRRINNIKEPFESFCKELGVFKFKKPL